MSRINDLGYLIHHLSAALDLQSDVILNERLGIGFAQVKVLMALESHDGVTQRFIADYWGQTQASISRQIQYMQDDGLVRVKVSQKNRREHRVILTAKGDRFLQKAYRLLNSYHAPVYSKLSDNQRSDLFEILEIMHRQTCRPDRPGNCGHF